MCGRRSTTCLKNTDTLLYREFPWTTMQGTDPHWERSRAGLTPEGRFPPQVLCATHSDANQVVLSLRRKLKNRQLTEHTPEA